MIRSHYSLGDVVTLRGIDGSPDMPGLVVDRLVFVQHAPSRRPVPDYVRLVARHPVRWWNGADGPERCFDPA